MIDNLSLKSGHLFCELLLDLLLDLRQILYPWRQLTHYLLLSQCHMLLHDLIHHIHISKHSRRYADRCVNMDLLWLSRCSLRRRLTLWSWNICLGRRIWASKRVGSDGRRERRRGGNWSEGVLVGRSCSRSRAAERGRIAKNQMEVLGSRLLNLVFSVLGCENSKISSLYYRCVDIGR